MSSPPENPYEITWDVPNRSLSIMESSIFPRKEHFGVQPVRFQIQFIPKTTVKTALIVLYLRYFDLPNQKQLKVHCHISILNKHGQRWRTKADSNTINKDKIGIVIGDLEVDRSDICTTPSLLHHGNIRIHCEINVPIPSIPKDKPITTTIPPVIESKLLQNYESLLESGAFSDLVFVFPDGSELRAHKNILSCRSAVFAAMLLNSDTKEAQTNRVEILDIDSLIFKAFLRYIYTDKIDDSLKQYGLELLSVADKYQFEYLKSRCEQYIGSKLEICSVAQILMLADMHQAKYLKAKCSEFIAANAIRVQNTDGWNVMVKERPELLALLFNKLSLKN